MTSDKLRVVVDIIKKSWAEIRDLSSLSDRRMTDCIKQQSFQYYLPDFFEHSATKFKARHKLSNMVMYCECMYWLVLLQS